MIRLASTLFLLPFFLAACSSSQESTTPTDAGPALNIQQPPSGSLSEEQLNSIGADIRQLETHPLAAGAKEGGRNLFMWIQGSPDVSVSLCGGVIGPLLDSDSRYQSELLTQFILSSAAYKIENPDAGDVAVNVGGLKGTIATYRVLMGQMGSRARDAFMESIADRSEADSLEDYVRSGLAEC